MESVLKIIIPVFIFIGYF